MNQHGHRRVTFFLIICIHIHSLICDIANLNRLKRKVRVILTIVKERDKQKQDFEGVSINLDTNNELDI